MRHFLHPKLLRKAREVRVQLEDIMKFQKMEIISAGTDFDVIRYAVCNSVSRAHSLYTASLERRYVQATSTKLRESRALASSSILELVCRPTFTRPVLYMAWVVSTACLYITPRWPLTAYARYADICHLP